MSGELPCHPVRKIICKGCGREFYTQIKGKKYCNYYLCGNRGYRKELSERAREARQDRICKACGKVFTPARSDGIYCSNACRQKAYRQSVTDRQVFILNTWLSVTSTPSLQINGACGVVRKCPRHVNELSVTNHRANFAHWKSKIKNARRNHYERKQKSIWDSHRDRYRPRIWEHQNGILLFSDKRESLRHRANVHEQYACL